MVYGSNERVGRAVRLFRDGLLRTGPNFPGNQVINLLIGPYPGYNPQVNAGTANAFATAAYRYGHSLIRLQFDRLDANYRPLAIGPLNLVNAFFNPTQFCTSLGTDPILRGLVSVNSRRVDEFLNIVLTTQHFQTNISPGMDLASLNIQRGQDHGLPPYPAWKKFCKCICNITSDFENELTLVRFLLNYGSLETLDLWVGGVVEGRLTNSLLGATFACIFGITFSNVRAGDRFFYENPGVFSPAQLRQIRIGTLSRVLCNNSDGINPIQPDAFLSNQTCVPCSQIPRLNIRPWREDVCFYHARVEPCNVDLQSGLSVDLFKQILSSLQPLFLLLRRASLNVSPSSVRLALWQPILLPTLQLSSLTRTYHSKPCPPSQQFDRST